MALMSLYWDPLPPWDSVTDARMTGTLIQDEVETKNSEMRHEVHNFHNYRCDFVFIMTTVTQY